MRALNAPQGTILFLRTRAWISHSIIQLDGCPTSVQLTCVATLLQLAGQLTALTPLGNRATLRSRNVYTGLSPRGPTEKYTPRVQSKLIDPSPPAQPTRPLARSPGAVQDVNGAGTHRGSGSISITYLINVGVHQVAFVPHPQRLVRIRKPDRGEHPPHAETLRSVVGRVLLSTATMLLIIMMIRWR
jgi:hypothetical protein